MNLELRDRVAVVVGGASGIGLAAAHGFSREGAHVVLWDRNENVHQLAKQLAKDYSVRALGCVVDVTNEAGVGLAMAQTVESFGQVGHLVHAAAIGSGQFGFPFTNLKPVHWLKVLEVNVMGMTHVAHAVTPHMTSRGERHHGVRGFCSWANGVADRSAVQCFQSSQYQFCPMHGQRFGT